MEQSVQQYMNLGTGAILLGAVREFLEEGVLTCHVLSIHLVQSVVSLCFVSRKTKYWRRIRRLRFRHYDDGCDFRVLPQHFFDCDRPCLLPSVGQVQANHWLHQLALLSFHRADNVH